MVNVVVANNYLKCLRFKESVSICNSRTVATSGCRRRHLAMIMGGLCMRSRGMYTKRVIGHYERGSFGDIQFDCSRSVPGTLCIAMCSSGQRTRGKVRVFSFSCLPRSNSKACGVIGSSSGFVLGLRGWRD